MTKQIVVRRYKNSGQFEQDANRQFDQGYEIIEVNGQQPPTAIVKGTLAFAMTGGLGFLIGGRAHKKDPILVTYRYSGNVVEQVRAPSRRDQMSKPAQLVALLLVVGVMLALAIIVLH